MLRLSDPGEKTAAARRLRRDWLDGRLELDEMTPVVALPIPGRPPQPLLVAPREVPRRGLGTREGRAALVHAVRSGMWRSVRAGSRKPAHSAVSSPRRRSRVLSGSMRRGR
ncbi:DUF455 family protein [Acidihalobacter sp.]|uniref:DUF455 family protein n=1 Tax=Acidihalobacter sp. TaxID=1872108 RepID=UPI00307D1F38